MDKAETERNGAGADDVSQLNRNRSFKSKQLVRSQAIRESQSPPRAISPAVVHPNISPSTSQKYSSTSQIPTSQSERSTPQPSAAPCASELPTPELIAPKQSALQSNHASTDSCEVFVDCGNDSDARKRPVAIQITSGAVESSEQRQRAKRWLVYKNNSDSSRDLLSNNPRVACICGACASCPHCRGRRRRHQCPSKQDSGIVCSDDCPDCSDGEQMGSAEDMMRNSGSLDFDDQPYCRCPERKERPKNNSLTRTDSDDKNEPTGVDLVNFIKETLNKNAKDRMTMLKIEKELHALVNDTGRCIVRFPVMTSYGRMLVHRCAALFQLSHHIDQCNKNSVMVSKSGTSGGRIPCTPFKSWCTANFPPSPQRHHETHAKSILKRDTLAGGEGGNGLALCARSKSLEQREKEYERVRRRIFSSDNCSQDEQWPWISGPVKLLTPDSGRNKLLKVQSLEGPGCAPRPPWRCRGPVSKSHSFSGYGNANNTGGQDVQQHPRVLSRQGDLASSSWRLSPSSSGYKTLSLRSTDSVTPSPTGGASPEPGVGAGANSTLGPAVGGGLNPTLGPGVAEGTVVWAVTDMAAVPAGAIVIHPQTGRPLTNPDGSIYHFDPANPPVLYEQNIYNHIDQKIDVNAEKRRGRLEKQNSFIDNDCECRTSEDCRDDCCCECRKHESCKQKSVTEKEINEKQLSPAKTRNEIQNQVQSNDPKPLYESTTNNKYPCETSTNQKQSIEVITNHKQPYEVTTNHRQPNEVTTNHRQPQDVTTNDRQPQDVTTNHRQPQEVTTNQQQPYEATTNQKQPYEVTTNQKQPYETTANHNQENQRQFEQSTNQKPSSEYSKRLETQRSFEQREQQNQRPVGEVQAIPPKTPSRESQDLQLYHQSYVPQFRPEEVTSPQMNNHLIQQEIVNIQNAMAQAKITPVPMADPNIRPVSLTNMMYQTPVPQGYPYVNPTRIDHQTIPQPIYQQLIHQGMEEVKQLAPSPHNNENTFRIDPSYPYPAMDYTAACGACVDPNAIHKQPRSYSVPYGQVEMTGAVIPPTYPVGNVILPQPHMQPYPYQEAVQWAGVPQALNSTPKLYVHELYPVMQYSTPYPQYNIVYPQVIPQPYPICQPIYPIVDKTDQFQRRNSATYHRPKHNSMPSSSRNTPITSTPDDKKLTGDERRVVADERKHIGDERKHIGDERKHVGDERRVGGGDGKNNEITARIQKMRDQLNDREREKEKREEWGRNSGNGILGCYPKGGSDGRIAGTSNNGDTQLSSAARAIVNTIRNMQAKNTYHTDPRRQDSNHPHHRYEHRAERQDFRPKRYDREGSDGGRQPRPEWGPRGVGRGDHCRPPYFIRQMSPGTWCRRSPGPVHPALNNPRRPHPDTRNSRRY